MPREMPERCELPKRRARNSPRRTRISKDPEERRQEIIETALKLFSENGYENTTIQDIVQRMNVSPGLCYRYFKSKTEIFAAASEYYAMKAVEQIQIPESDGMPALEKLSLFLRKIFEYVIKHKEFEADYHGETEIRASRLDYVAGQMTELLVPIIRQGAEEHVFHCENVQRTTKFLVFGLMHTFHDEIPEERTEEYILEFRGFLQEIFAGVLKIENWENR